jgi:cardiolipin synthase
MVARNRRPAASCLAGGRRRDHDNGALTPSPLLTALPNLLSLGRLLAVPVAIWLMLADHNMAALWLFVAAGISDALDGFLARQLAVRSVIGGYLDPIADKVLLVSVYVTLGYRGHIDNWLVILVVFRDFLILGGAGLHFLVEGTLSMRPLLVSKLNTTAQLVLASLVLGKLAFAFDDYGMTIVLTYAVAATTFVSGAAYLIIWGRRILGMGPNR